MSIIIKGIDLPKEKDIVIKIKPNREVLKQLAFETVFVETEAEAIQIPTPHGRIIDWDAFNDRLTIGYAEGRGKTLAPTILDEEGK